MQYASVDAPTRSAPRSCLRELWRSRPENAGNGGIHVLRPTRSLLRHHPLPIAHPLLLESLAASLPHRRRAPWPPHSCPPPPRPPPRRLPEPVRRLTRREHRPLATMAHQLLQVARRPRWQAAPSRRPRGPVRVSCRETGRARWAKSRLSHSGRVRDRHRPNRQSPRWT